MVGITVKETMIMAKGKTDSKGKGKLPPWMKQDEKAMSKKEMPMMKKKGMPKKKGKC
jgi:hypothetical protein